MKFNTVALANASAAVTAVFYLVCALGVALFPDLFMTVTNSWFHWIDLSKISGNAVTAGGLILGLVSLTVVAWLTGYAFAWAYNLFLKGK